MLGCGKFTLEAEADCGNVKFSNRKIFFFPSFLFFLGSEFEINLLHKFLVLNFLRTSSHARASPDSEHQVHFNPSYNKGVE
jgi:hypothetical protein